MSTVRPTSPTESVITLPPSYTAHASDDTVPVHYGFPSNQGQSQSTSIHPHAEPIVMSWSNPEVVNTSRRPRPTQPLEYSFSPFNATSTLVIPPAEAEDSRPLYNISITLNCFFPATYTTTVRRGAHENGEEIGDYRMAEGRQRAESVTFHGDERWVEDVMTTHISKDYPKVNFTGSPLQWRFFGKEKVINFKCVSSNRQEVATFYPRPATLRSPGEPAPLARVVVQPAGHDRLDEIMMGILLVEGSRLAARVRT